MHPLENINSSVLKDLYSLCCSVECLKDVRIHSNTFTTSYVFKFAQITLNCILF